MSEKEIIAELSKEISKLKEVNVNLLRMIDIMVSNWRTAGCPSCTYDPNEHDESCELEALMKDTLVILASKKK